MEIRKAIVSEIPKVESFYELVDYKPGVNKSDFLLITELTGNIVGAVRLVQEQNELVLRGMMIHPDFQRRGIGSKMLKICAEHMGDQICYCIPYDYLEEFYNEVGFKKTEANQAPIFLQTRLNSYLNDGMDTIIMRKDSK